MSIDNVVSELLMRASDGNVSDEDVEWLLKQLPAEQTNLKDWLQDILDKIGPENLQLLGFLYMWYRMRKR